MSAKKVTVKKKTHTKKMERDEKKIETESTAMPVTSHVPNATDVNGGATRCCSTAKKKGYQTLYLYKNLSNI